MPLICILLCLGVQVSAQTQWQSLDTPVQGNLTDMHFISADSGWICGSGGRILFTANGGAQWEIQQSGVSFDISSIYFLDPLNGWAITWDPNVFPITSLILSTIDGGENWQSTPYPQDDVIITDIYFRDADNGWLSAIPSIFLETTDGGQSWSESSIDSGDFAFMPIQSFTFYDQQHAIAAGGRFDFAGVIWRTSNYGQNWTVQALGPEPVFAIEYIDSLNIIGVGGDLEFGATVVRSSDGGASWDYVNLEIFGVGQSISFRTANEAWMPLGFGRAFAVSFTGGSTWFSAPTPGGVLINQLVFTDSLTGYAIGEKGTVLKYTIAPVEVSSPDSPHPLQQAVLYQNYPNPFNATTDFGFRIADFGLVKIHIYDIQGRLVKTVLHTEMQPGSYTASWEGRDGSGNDVASGVYFYRLAVHPASRKPKSVIEMIRKMILIR